MQNKIEKAGFSVKTVNPALFFLHACVVPNTLLALYGFPGRVDEIKRICEKHGVLLIEDAAETMGATVNGRQCGSFGDYSAISFNGNKIITGSSGGCLLTNDIEVANKARKWSTQAREDAPWYQHEEVGYNYRMSNVIAGVIRGQYPHLEEHIAQKKAIYERYREGLKDLPVQMNPITAGTEPNYWLSALIIDKDYMCHQVRDNLDVCYVPEAGKTCPTEVLEALASINFVHVGVNEDKAIERAIASGIKPDEILLTFISRYIWVDEMDGLWNREVFFEQIKHVATFTIIPIGLKDNNKGITKENLLLGYEYGLELNNAYSKRGVDVGEDDHCKVVLSKPMDIHH